MENKLKRLFSLAVAVIMVISLMPLNGLQVYAAEEVTNVPLSGLATPSTTDVTLTGVLSETATGNIEDSWCPVCKKEVTWVPITEEALPAFNTAVHYYVPQNRNAEGEIQGVTNDTKNAKK